MRATLLVGAVCTFCILLSACQTQPKGTFCAIASPIPLTQQTIDHLTDDEVTALLRHQRLGGKLCGWRQ